ncbi:MAG: hypothetical protein ACFFG0_46240, partial [Candidatus Thorarchaeota archaeon]
MAWLNEWLIKVAGEEKAKWLKGVFAWFLLMVLSNLLVPLTMVITGSGIDPVWIAYILIVLNAGLTLIGTMIIIFIGKPIIP